MDLTNGKNYPHWAYDSMHDFRKTKRAEVKQLVKALNDVRFGCAYIPGAQSAINTLAQASEELKRLVSVKEWGR